MDSTFGMRQEGTCPLQVGSTWHMYATCRGSYSSCNECTHKVCILVRLAELMYMQGQLFLKQWVHIFIYMYKTCLVIRASLWRQGWKLE